MLSLMFHAQSTLAYHSGILCKQQQLPFLSVSNPYLKDISECEDLGKSGSLTPARDSINDIRAEGCRILLYIHWHFTLDCDLQMLTAFIHYDLDD